MKTARFFTGMIIMFLLFSCNADISGLRLITGKGPVMNEERMLDSFDKIQCSIGADINIIESDSFCVTISAQENVLNGLKTRIVNGTLKIDFNGYSVRTSRKIVVNIHMPAVRKFSLSGAADLKSDLPIPEIVISGSGEVYCKGKTESVMITINGSGNMNLYDMEVKDADVRISGAGNVRLFATNSLQVVISGVGNVFYRGEPTVEKSIHGSGFVKADKSEN